jgi:hypothetical protein
LGYYPESTEFNKHLLAVGLTYKAEYQDLMTPGFTETLQSIVNIQMFTRTKIDGLFTLSDPLVLDPCSTLDLNNFYDAGKSSVSSMEFLQEFKPMQCLDEGANLELEPTRQQSSQVVSGISANDRVTGSRGGQDVKLNGDNHNRHDNWRDLHF